MSGEKNQSSPVWSLEQTIFLQCSPAAAVICCVTCMSPTARCPGRKAGSQEVGVLSWGALGSAALFALWFTVKHLKDPHFGFCHPLDKGPHGDLPCWGNSSACGVSCVCVALMYRLGSSISHSSNVWRPNSEGRNCKRGADFAASLQTETLPAVATAFCGSGSKEQALLVAVQWHSKQQSA